MLPIIALLAAVAPGGDWPALLTALVVCATLVALLIGQRGPDMAMIGGVVVLLAAGILTPEEALKGMANEGMITVAALFVVAAAVERTGALATVDSTTYTLRLTSTCMYQNRRAQASSGS